MPITYSTLPFALLGILFGIIFVSDGWLSYQGSDQSFAKSPKVRGLVYILGGGVIPVVRELTHGTDAERQINTISVYTLFVSLSILLALFILSIYAFLVSFKRLRKISTNESWFEIAIESLPFVSVAIQEGNQKFKEAIENKLTLKAIEQRDVATEFLSTAYSDLVKFRVEDLKGCQEFESFTRQYLEEFIRNFLDDTKGNYRACLYYLDETSNEFLFFTGCSPQTAPYTRKKIPAKGSLAGYAITNPYKVHLWFSSQKKAEVPVPFLQRKPPGRYKSVVACAVKRIHQSKNRNSSKLVLCIDCIYQANAFGDFEYIARMIVLLSILLADAQILIGVDNNSIKEHIQNLN
jgi:hypothetical protein